MNSNCDQNSVVKFESLISSYKNSTNENDVNEIEEVSDSEVQEKIIIPKGKCKSGRFWKTPKERFKTMVKTRGLQSTLEKRKQIQEEIKKAKQLTRDALDERKKQKEEQRQRRIENLKKKQENEKKSEVVQVIKNLSKLKKKHLRMIEKRDTLPFLNKTVV